jgi:hypothetical protein
MFQQVPATRLVIGAQQQDRLCTGSTPKEARAFESQVDHSANRAFNRPTANRHFHRHQFGIGHASLILDEVIAMLTNGFAVTAPAKLTHRINHPLQLTSEQPPTLLVAPAAAGLRAPVFALGRDFAKVLGRMIEVKEFVDLLRS